jgi:transcriptional regulator GlxA family with amidase domain
MCNRLFEVLLLRVMRQMIAESRLDTGLLAALSDRQLSRALAAIHVKPEQPWTVEGMAVAAAMSRPRFAARFHEVMGQTPAHYLASWRIGLAQRWLLQGKPMDWIAGQVGYDSASALARAFRRHVGQAPRQWLVAKANAGLA